MRGFSFLEKVLHVFLNPIKNEERHANPYYYRFCTLFQQTKGFVEHCFTLRMSFISQSIKVYSYSVNFSSYTYIEQFATQGNIK